ncbi:MAG: transcriptional repressor [Clostridiales bacterium]|nr:transcriptional repressor [Clostridiales bacterium]
MKATRYSRQRELIYRCLRDTDQHPTAEMLYQWLKVDNPNLSLGTVYRNLNLLSEQGAITRLHFPVERFDANVTPHPHFQCLSCGQVYDLALSYDKTLDAAARDVCDFHIQFHELLYKGTCSDCAKAPAAGT